MLNTLHNLSGIPIVVNPHLYKLESKQFRFPRSKRRRIRDKWRKQARNYKPTVVPQAFMFDTVIHAHPLVVKAVQKGCIKRLYWIGMTSDVH